MSQIFGQNSVLYREISVYLRVVGLDGGVCHVCHALTRIQIERNVFFFGDDDVRARSIHKKYSKRNWNHFVYIWQVDHV